MKQVNTLLIPALGRSIDLNSISVDGIDMEDAFDFCDAFISEAKFSDGFQSFLTSQELDTLNDCARYDTAQEEHEVVSLLIHHLACEACVS